MKNLLKTTVLLLALIVSIKISAQCWTQPTPDQTVNVSGDWTNYNYTGSILFTGSGRIFNSVNVNKWDFLIYQGSLIVDGPVNMNKGSNVYATGSVQFDQVHWTGGDTIFINGTVTINSVVSNNSVLGERNAIVLKSTSSVSINGRQYVSGETIKTPGNDKNEIDVISCNETTLPVKFIKTTINRRTERISWSMGDQLYVGSYFVMGSNDASKWEKVGAEISVNKNGEYMASITTDTPVNKSASVSIIFAIVAVLVAVSGYKRKFIAAAVILLAGTFTVGSCSKQEVTQPDNGTSYKYYMIQANLRGGGVIYSPVIK